MRRPSLSNNYRRDIMTPASNLSSFYQDDLSVTQAIDRNSHVKFAMSNIADIKAILDGRKMDRSVLARHCKRNHNATTNLLLKLDKMEEKAKFGAIRRPTPLDMMDKQY